VPWLDPFDPALLGIAVSTGRKQTRSPRHDMPLIGCQRLSIAAWRNETAPLSSSTMLISPNTRKTRP